MISPDIETRITIAQLKWPQYRVWEAKDGNVVWFELEDRRLISPFCSCGGSISRGLVGDWEISCDHIKEWIGLV